MENRCTDQRPICSSLIVIATHVLTTCELIQVSNRQMCEARSVVPAVAWQ